MRLHIIKYATLAFLVSTQLPSLAQDMNSPYSVYGIGELEDREHNRTAGMASTTLAIRSGQFIASGNPAALTALPRSVFIANIAFAGRFVGYTGDPIDATNSSNRDFGVERLTLGIKINSFWGSAIGFKKFSRVSYQFNGAKSVDGSTEFYNVLYQGDGGLNNYYWTNSFSIGKHLSAGITSSLIAGSINQTETTNEATSQKTISSKVQDFFSQGRLEYGLQYYTNIGKSWDLTLGGKLANKTKLRSDRTLTVTEDGTTILEEEYIKKDRFYLPSSYGVGIALENRRGNTFAADYSFADWSSLNIKEQGWRLVNSSRLSVGAEFAKFKNAYNQQQYEKGYFQFGAFLSNSYLRIRNNQIKEYGVTAGIGGALKGNLLYSIGAEVGTRGTINSGLIKENFFRFTFSLSYRELLYSKGRKYD